MFERPLALVLLLLLLLLLLVPLFPYTDASDSMSAPKWLGGGRAEDDDDDCWEKGF